MTVIKREIEEIKNHLGCIKPPMPAFVYDDIIGLFPKDEQGRAAGESCVDVLRRHLSTEIGEIEKHLFAIETQVSFFEERLAGALRGIEQLNEALGSGFPGLDLVGLDDEKDAELLLKHRALELEELERNLRAGIEGVYEELRFAREHWGGGR